MTTTAIGKTTMTDPDAPTQTPVAARPAPTPRPAPVAKQRPDPRPMRLGLGAGAIAAMSIMAAGLIRFPVADPIVEGDDEQVPQAVLPRDVRVEKRARYEQLKPGQKAPRGATVIDAVAPTPRVVVRTVQVQDPAPRVKKAKTRQSGRG